MSHSPAPNLPPRPAPLASDAHKGEAGRVLCFAGSREMPGAALLCATAAMRGGAGLVTLACFDEALLAAAPVARPELILWDLSAADADADAGLRRGLETRRFDVVVAGPGLGTGLCARRLFAALLESWDGALVLDADALNMLAADEQLRERVRASRAPIVITPHPGEAARLLGRPVGRTGDERRAAACELSLALGAVTVLKGAGSVVVDATGESVWINPSGNPGLATAGSGDVLAGLLAALLARAGGVDGAWEAARAAAYLHGLAGDRVAERLGESALLAGDLAVEFGPAARAGPWA